VISYFNYQKKKYLFGDITQYSPATDNTFPIWISKKNQSSMYKKEKRKYLDSHFNIPNIQILLFTKQFTKFYCLLLKNCLLIIWPN
jgi:hypothetical protein